MKHLLTISALLVSSLAMGQWPSLPYNPDDNADGLIGVADLQALLANYGSEFSSAVVSEDGESAIVYMGEMSYPLCAMSCKNLPGKWELPNVEDLALVWEEVYTFDIDTYTWLKPDKSNDLQKPNVFVSRQYTPSSYHYSSKTGEITHQWRCYCAAKQLPRVEYFLCSTDQPGQMQSCVDSKLAEGWFLLGSPFYATDSGNFWNQALWRWAE